MPVMPVGKSRRRRKVTFKNTYTPDVVPPPKVESYDELVFNVAGLFHTLSFLHDPDDWGDAGTGTGSMSSEDDFYEPEPPLERSVPLMIAEFLYRSAIFLGHPQGDTPWLPGFRLDKKFSGNDVKRWRRLAHFDWEAEERAFLKNHRKPGQLKALQPRSDRSESVESNGNTSVMSTLGMSFHVRQLENEHTKATTDTTCPSQKTKFRATMAGWFRKHRTCQEDKELNVVTISEDESAVTTFKPVSWLNPPPLSSSKDLQLLVAIVNSCVYCGQFQFRQRDIVRLCNVKI